ncbi:MAG: GrdX family protein [Megasphaera sp.]|jgi:hypothetical protein|nr:GrdX family protein [Megasphaera sp.]MCH4187717.1 GrdX family protein [Megasphaera sp.]MCH4217616.1 GrdX family protein [Megasphaera sp.]MCI1248434.1 GrdX family protein [Megasphaera sp.]
MEFRIITNNPAVQQTCEKDCTIEFHTETYMDVLVRVRGLVQQGCKLLSHPLSGSVKPNETPYKSVMVSVKAGPSVDTESELIIEECITACRKFADLHRQWTDSVLRDFQYIDYTLISSAIASAKELG